MPSTDILVIGTHEITGTSNHCDCMIPDIAPRDISLAKSPTDEARITAGCWGSDIIARYRMSSSWMVLSRLAPTASAVRSQNRPDRARARSRSHIVVDVDLQGEA